MTSRPPSALAHVLEFRDVVKGFGSTRAVDQVSFAIQPGEIFTLLGPSGCGKTTTLRLVAGLEEPDAGEVLINGAAVAAPRRGLFVAPDKRSLGMVFQSYAIWPHLTVFENVAFPLRVRGEKSQMIRERVIHALETVGLAGLESRGATELSGGQQQRVALARALVYAPSILLLDEPLSNLDAKLREQMRLEIRALQQKLKLTVLYVTHDQAEAMSLSDRIAVMLHGRFEQVGTPAEVYEGPASDFVADFLGRTVKLEGKIGITHAGCWIEFSAGDARMALGGEKSISLAAGTAVRLFARPEDIDILPPGEPRQNELAARIERVVYAGDHFEYLVQAAGTSFMLSGAKKQRHAEGSSVRLIFDPARISIRCP